MDLPDILPGEFAGIFGIPLLVAVILILVAGRRDDDPGATRVQARYLGAIGIVSLFIALFAFFGVARGLADLIIDKDGAHSGIPKEFQEMIESMPGLEGIPIPGLGGGGRGGDAAVGISADADYRLAMQSGLVGLAAAAVFVFHIRRARSLVPRDGFARGATGRVARAGLYGACFVAALVVLVASAKGAYGLFRVIAPGITGSGDHDVERQRGIAEILSYLFLTVGGAMVFFRAWYWIPEHRGEGS